MSPKANSLSVITLCAVLLTCGNKSPTGVNAVLTLAVGGKTTSSMTLSWTPSTSYEFAAYKLFRSKSAGVSELGMPVAAITDRLTTSYSDTGLEAGTVYYYRVYNFEGVSKGVASNETMDTTLMPVVIPDTVVLAVSNKTMTTLTLSWTPCKAADFAAYKLFRADSAGVTEFSTPLATMTDRLTTSFIDTGLDAGSFSYYRVYLYRGLNTGVGSNEVLDSTLLTEPPLPKDTVVLAASNMTKTSITLSWTPCPNTDFAAYKLFRADSAGVTEFSTPLAMITSRLVSTFVDTGLDAGAVKFYRVYLYRGMSAGVGSNEVKDSTLLTDPPVVHDSIALAVTNRTKSSLTLSWTQCGSVDFAAYKLFRSDSATITEFSTPVAIITSRATTSFTDTTLDSGRIVYYRVYQYRGLTNGVGSNIVKDSTQRPGRSVSDTIPIAVSNRTASSITLSWTPSTKADFVAYKLFKSASPGVTELSIPVAIITSRVASSYTDSGLAHGTTVYYRLFNYEGLNGGAASNEIKDSTLTQDVVVPNKLSLTVSGRTATSLTLTWNQSTSADFVAYKLFKSNAAGVTDLSMPVAVITNRITTSYTDINLASGSTVYYRLFNFAGFSTGVASDEIKDSTNHAIPDTIVLAVSNRTKTSITLSWTQCADSSFAAYKIFKSDTAGVTDFSVPVTVISNRMTTSYSEMGLDSGIVLFYRVYQFKDLSAGVASNEVKALTVCPERNGMVYIGAGTFMMGSITGESNEMPVHRVTLTKGFWLDRTEVTQTDYNELMGVNPSMFSSVSGGPVESVTWFDAALYCNKRSKRDGLDTVYNYTSVTDTPGDHCIALGGLTIDLAKSGYRLPTEAEWEFACRAGATTEYYWGSDSIADYVWYNINGGGRTHTVATKLPNAYGLYDMNGNVWEWCNDWFFAYNDYPQTNPTGASTSTTRILRGGNWSGTANYLRSTLRLPANPYDAYETIGFRVARSGQ